MTYDDLPESGGSGEAPAGLRNALETIAALEGKGTLADATALARSALVLWGANSMPESRAEKVVVEALGGRYADAIGVVRALEFEGLLASGGSGEAGLTEAGDRLATMLRASFQHNGYGTPEHEEHCREALREWNRLVAGERSARNEGNDPEGWREENAPSDVPALRRHDVAEPG